MSTVTTTPPATAGPFRRRTLIGLIAVGVASLVIALVLAVFADDFADDTTAGANGYSRSAIGHRALVEILEALDVPVLVSQSQSAAKAQHGLLIVAEPAIAPQADAFFDQDEDEDADQVAATKRFVAMVRAAPRVLVVLPRWTGERAADEPGWITERRELSTDGAQAVLDALELDLEVVPGTTQTVDGDALEIDEELDGAILLGHTSLDDDTELWILSDPGRIDNAGLRDRGNLHFAIELIDELRAGGPVVFDETVHGYTSPPSLWKSLLRFPLVLASLQVLICAGLLLWAAVGRYGPARLAPPPLPSGKAFLIRNTAALLHSGGHDAEALRRYLATTIHGVRQTLHAPRDLEPAALRTWLERVRADRGGTVSLPELERDVNIVDVERRGQSRRIVELAARIHRWRTEMTHGPRNHP